MGVLITHLIDIYQVPRIRMPQPKRELLEHLFEQGLIIEGMATTLSNDAL